MSRMLPTDKKPCLIDFEFNQQGKKPNYNLVSCSLMTEGRKRSFWLESDPEEQKRLKNHLLFLRESHYMVAYNVSAEARCFLALKLNPIKFDWIDLQAEWKMLVNHNHDLNYGKHLHNGQVQFTCPAYGLYSGTLSNNHAPAKKSLLACTYKLLGILEDADYKDQIRDKIINTPPGEFEEEFKVEVMKYGESDIQHLSAILRECLRHYKNKLGARSKNYKDLVTKEIWWRGESVARQAVMEWTGYPIALDEVVEFTKNVPEIIKAVQEDINVQFPEMQIFVPKKDGTYTFKQKPLRDWITAKGLSDLWPKTSTGSLSLSLDCWLDYSPVRHSFSRGVLNEQIVRYLKLNQSLNGFKPKTKGAKNKDTFFTAICTDGRVRSYLPWYNAQSGRAQPPATTFLFLKSAWMRVFCQPRPGRAMIAIDYSSQEFFISALVSGDENMIKAYLSGDPYFYFAKLAGAVPWDGERKDYEEIRDRFKSTVLGLSYGMAEKALAKKLTRDTGSEVEPWEAYELTLKFQEAFPVYTEYHEMVIQEYEMQAGTGHIKLPDGWYMWGDNPNPRSVGNVGIQGFGACVLRKAIQLCQDEGLKVCFPLHDALYVEAKSHDWAAVLLFRQCMIDAFAYYFPDRPEASQVRVDIETWSYDYKDEVVDKFGVAVTTKNRYVDKRSKDEFNYFKKYFNPIMGE